MKEATWLAGTYVTDSMKPWHSTRPRSGKSRTDMAAVAFLPAASANLGYLRSAFGLFEFGGRLRRRCSGGVLGQAQLQQVTRRHGVLAADHDDLPEEPLQSGRRVAVKGCLAAEDSAEEPARAINADEAGHAVALAAVRAAGGKLRHEFGAEAALDLLDLAALAADRLPDLLTDFIPQALGAGGGEGLQLKARSLQVHGDGDDALARLFNLQAELEPLAGCDQQRTEVHVPVLVVDFRDVEGAGRGRCRGGVTGSFRGHSVLVRIGPGRLLLFGFPAAPKNHGVSPSVVILYRRPAPSWRLSAWPPATPRPVPYSVHHCLHGLQCLRHCRNAGDSRGVAGACAQAGPPKPPVEPKPPPPRTEPSSSSTGRNLAYSTR